MYRNNRRGETRRNRENKDEGMWANDLDVRNMTCEHNNNTPMDKQSPKPTRSGLANPAYEKKMKSEGPTMWVAVYRVCMYIPGLR